ncbi:hypothetical protein BH09BAC1_BH09BAC1_24410 [soil metagenome]
MKTLLLVITIALSIPLASQAQLLNGDFEILNDTMPANWVTSDFGAGLKDNYTHSGDYSLAVWNWYYYGRGYAVNGDTYASMFDKMVGAGTPSTEKAIRLTGYYYYDTTGTDTNADTAVVTIAYRKWNIANNDYDTVAYGVKPLLPTSGNTMQPFSLPIDDLMPGVDPDTMVVVIISSLDGFCNTSGAGNCLYLYMDDLQVQTTTGIQSIMGQFEGLKLYPNPTNQYINVTVEADNMQWSLYDLSGRLVQSYNLHIGENRLDVSTPAGLYIATLQQGGQVIAREKLVKE